MICAIGSALKESITIIIFKINAEIEQAYELFYKNKLSETDGDPHKTWQVINELILLINPARLLLRN